MSHISIHTVLGSEEGHPALFFRPFHHGGPPDKDLFFWRPPPFSVVKPRPSSRNHLDAAVKSSLANEKSSPPRCWVRQTICRLCQSTVLYICGDVVMSWGRSAHHKDQKRRKQWWRSCRGSRGTNVSYLFGSKIAKNRWNLDEVDKTRCNWPFRPKTGMMCLWPIAGLLASDLYLVLECT